MNPGVISDTLYYQSINVFSSVTYYYACGLDSSGMTLIMKMVLGSTAIANPLSSNI